MRSLILIFLSFLHTSPGTMTRRAFLPGTGTGLDFFKSIFKSYLVDAYRCSEIFRKIEFSSMKLQLAIGNLLNEKSFYQDFILIFNKMIEFEDSKYHHCWCKNREILYFFNSSVFERFWIFWIVCFTHDSKKNYSESYYYFEYFIFCA